MSIIKSTKSGTYGMRVLPKIFYDDADYYFGTTYKDGDWFKVTFTGYNACGENVGSVDYYLADFREGKSFIEESWAYVDLSTLGRCVNKVEISFSGTDIGEYGLNTPTYCVIDEIGYRIYD